MRRLICVWWLALLMIAPVQAHNLELSWEVIDQALEIAGEIDGEAAAGAKVEVRSATGTVLATGALDEGGKWSWVMRGREDLAVVVDAGMGHRQTLKLRAEDVGHWHSRETVAAAADHAPPGGLTAPSGVRIRGSSDGTWPVGMRVLLGLALVLALSAAWMSYRNMIRLRALERRWGNHEG